MTFISFEFLIERINDNYIVTSKYENNKTGGQTLELDLGQQSRFINVVQQIEEGHCNIEDLKDVGSQLWCSLLTVKTSEIFKNASKQAIEKGKKIHVYLSMPTELLPLPWETLYNEKTDEFLASSPHYCIIHRPPNTSSPPSSNNKQKIRILVVIPEGSGLDVLNEWNNIKISLAKLKDIVEIERLSGKVTPDRIANALQQNFDIFHFIGHGKIDNDRNVFIRINDDEDSNTEHWVDADTFASMFEGNGIALIVLNCCLGAVSSPNRSLSGLGPALLKKGIPAVIAMRYSIPDTVAIKFSNIFYQDLFRGNALGQVCDALEQARRAIRRNQKEDTTRGFVTPVLYLAQDCEQLFTIQAPMEGATQQKNIQIKNIDIPEDLVEALSRNRCIPVLGPKLIEQPMLMRSVNNKIGPMDLALLLAEKSDYPDSNDLAICDQNSDWFCFELLQRVCQHFENSNKRFKLIDEIRHFFSYLEVPDYINTLGHWTVPGFFCTHIDGMLIEVVEKLDKRIQIVNNISDNISTDLDTPLLVNLRGVWSDENSLVLTENDHDELWSKMQKMAAQISTTICGTGKSLLFLGVSPRDPLIRRFCSLVLKPELTQNQGPVFFVCKSFNNVDKNYWQQKYEMHWVEADPVNLIHALDYKVRHNG